MPGPYNKKERSPRVAPCPGPRTEGTALGAESRGPGPAAGGSRLPRGSTLQPTAALPAAGTAGSSAADCKSRFQENLADGTFPKTAHVPGPQGPLAHLTVSLETEPGSSCPDILRARNRSSRLLSGHRRPPPPECHGPPPVSSASPLTGGLTRVQPANSLSCLGMSYRDLSPVSHRLYTWSTLLYPPQQLAHAGDLEAGQIKSWHSFG